MVQLFIIEQIVLQTELLKKMIFFNNNKCKQYKF